jgi:hypothetical protein
MRGVVLPEMKIKGFVGEQPELMVQFWSTWIRSGVRIQEERELRQTKGGEYEYST